MKLYMEPIEVRLEGGLPRALRWRKRVYRVHTVAEQWTWRGRWWADAATLEGERRRYYRVLCDHAHFEIFHRSDGAGTPPWMLSRALD